MHHSGPALLVSLLSCGTAFAAGNDAERDSAFWVGRGQQALAQARALFPGMPERARNVILFVGDGMSTTTIDAARIFEGQRRGESGEENALSFEQLPFMALARTYGVDVQIPDSAATMSAVITGVKTGDGMLSVTAGVRFGEGDRALVGKASVPTLLELAEGAGLATGVVSTARLSHATPAACYAHSASRDWEADSDRPAGAAMPDIAAQLIDRFGADGIGDGLEVALGGGRLKFLPVATRDPEYAEQRGVRADGRDLTAEWQRRFHGSYVWNKAGFETIDPKRTTHLLGLFEPSHLRYESDRAQDRAGEPSLTEMTLKAIEILQRNPRGFFLMVEGGRIDHAHHAGNAYRALNETVALSDAVRAALEHIDRSQTLVIVTADHSHTLTMGGYPKRGNPILGTVVENGKTEPARAWDGQAYTTLFYGNGLGTWEGVPGDEVYGRAPRAGRVGDPGAIDTTHPDYHQQVLVPLDAETHSGEDVPVFAGGPGAQLIHGVQEQSYTFYVMRAALGL